MTEGPVRLFEGSLRTARGRLDFDNESSTMQQVDLELIVTATGTLNAVINVLLSSQVSAMIREE